MHSTICLATTFLKSFFFFWLWVKQISTFQASSNSFIFFFSYLHKLVTFKAKVLHILESYYDRTLFLVATFNNGWLFRLNKPSQVQLEFSWSRMYSVEVYLLHTLLLEFLNQWARLCMLILGQWQRFKRARSIVHGFFFNPFVSSHLLYSTYKYDNKTNSKESLLCAVSSAHRGGRWLK